MFQVFAQCLSIHLFIYDLIVLSLKDWKFFSFNRNTGMRNHFVTTRSKIRHRIIRMLSAFIVNWELIISSAEQQRQENSRQHAVETHGQC